MNPNTNKSEEIKDLITALAKAQGMMKPAVFNKGNPHFKSRYADFNSCMDACRIPLSENGLAIIQYCDTIEGKMSLVTMLAHTSGQWMKSEFPLYPSKMDSQGIGSAMTYAKRYSLCGMVGIVADEDLNDDDGEAAVGRGKNVPQKPNEPPKQTIAPLIPKISSDLVRELEDLESKVTHECRTNCIKYMQENFSCIHFKDLTEIGYRKVKSAYEHNIKLQEVSNAQNSA